MSYRDDLQALVSRHNALDAEVVRARRERDQLRTMIDSAQARLRLPVLDNVRVASPCTQDWTAMQGDERVRHCGRCDQNVYNLSEMTREEAQALLIAKEGRLCVKYFRRKQDGTIITKDCPVGAQRRRRWMFGIGVIATLVGAVFGFLSLRKRAGTEQRLGEIAVERDNSYRGGHDSEMGGISELLERPHAPPARAGKP